MTLKIHGTDNIQPNTISDASIFAGITGAGATVISSIYVTDSLYNNTGANAVDTTGGYIKMLGINFYPGSNLVIGSMGAISLTYVSSTELRAQLPAQASGEYTLYLTNPNGSLYIKPNGVTYSGAVQWVTGQILPNQPLGTVTTSIQLEATGDGAITYTLQTGSTLPGTITLNSSTGLLSGAPPAVLTGTNFNFTIIATDAELQSTPRTFTLPVAANALPGRLLLVGGGGAGGKQTGGGGGGFIDLTSQIKIGIPYSITVGLGGTGNTGYTSTTGGTNTAGLPTEFGTNYTNEGIIALGGGRGGTGASYGPNFDLYINGGSGGHGNGGAIGLGLQPTSASGGFGNNSGNRGGGGAGEAGGTDGQNQGGDGLVSDITGTATYYAGGGGGQYASTGGLGGGGSGYTTSPYGGGRDGSGGTANTGGGGGGGNWPMSDNIPFTGQPASPANAMPGGSGILVLKVPNTYTATFSAGTTYSIITSVAGFNIYRITAAINQTVTFS